MSPGSVSMQVSPGSVSLKVCLHIEWVCRCVSPYRVGLHVCLLLVCVYRCVSRYNVKALTYCELKAIDMKTLVEVRIGGQEEVTGRGGSKIAVRKQMY